MSFMTNPGTGSLIADEGGDGQISTATKILAEVIASDASWLAVPLITSSRTTKSVTKPTWYTLLQSETGGRKREKSGCHQKYRVGINHPKITRCSCLADYDPQSFPARDPLRDLKAHR